MFGLVLTSCSSESSGTATDLGSQELTADDVVETYIAALKPLRTVGDTDGNPETEFRQVSAELTPLVAPLTDGIEGIPEEVTSDLAVAAGSMSIAIDLAADCLSAGETSAGCQALIDNSVTQAEGLGQALAALLPYSSWTLEEVLGELS